MVFLKHFQKFYFKHESYQVSMKIMLLFLQVKDPKKIIPY